MTTQKTRIPEKYDWLLIETMPSSPPMVDTQPVRALPQTGRYTAPPSLEAEQQQQNKLGEAPLRLTS